MTNKDVLISAIEQDRLNYGGATIYSGYPAASTIMNDVNITMPSEVTFTYQDLSDVANYCVSRYPTNIYTYKDWYAVMVQYLSSRIVTEPVITPITILPPGTITPPGETTTPPGTTEPFKISTNMLLIGGAILLFLFMSKGKGLD